MYSLTMTEPVFMGIDDLRPKLGPRVNQAAIAGRPTVITRNGTPYAALISYEEFELLRAVRNSQAQPTPQVAA